MVYLSHYRIYLNFVILLLSAHTFSLSLISSFSYFYHCILRKISFELRGSLVLLDTSQLFAF
jgi:hypothetical protein